MAANPLLSEGKFQQEAQESGLGWAATGQSGGPGAEHIKGTMTVGGTATAVGVLLALILVSGYFGWQAVEPVEKVVLVNGQTVYSGGNIPGWVFIGGILGFICVLVGSFVPKLARIMGPLYALGYGAVVGAISAYFEQRYDGIVLQAIGATLGVFAVMFFLYASRIIKVTRKYVLIVIGATFGLVAFYLVAFLASWLFNVDLYFMNKPTPLGILVSIGIAALAAATLAIDFAFIEQMSHGGAPRYMEWYGAMGLTVTLVWLYLRLLQLIALLRN